MQHPYAYPEVFISIFLGLDLDVNILAQCATVCRAWRDFIHGYLWNSERVKVCDLFFNFLKKNLICIKMDLLLKIEHFYAFYYFRAVWIIIGVLAMSPVYVTLPL